MKQEVKLNKIKLRGREIHMIKKTMLDRDGDPCIRAVPQNLVNAYLAQGWEKLTKPPVEAKTTIRKPRKLKTDVDTKE